jgi:hypothetical protein
MLFNRRRKQIRRCPQGHQLASDEQQCRYCEEDRSRILDDGNVPPVDTVPVAIDSSLSGDRAPAANATGSVQSGTSQRSTSVSMATAAYQAGVAPIGQINEHMDMSQVYDPRAFDVPEPPESVPIDDAPLPGADDPEDSWACPAMDSTRCQRLPSLEPGPVAWLIVTNGTMRGMDFRLNEQPMRIGRTRKYCQICLETDQDISGRHAELRLLKGKYLILDLGSTNGTKVNGKPILRRQLKDGDRIRVGGTDLVFKSVAI